LSGLKQNTYRYTWLHQNDAAQQHAKKITWSAEIPDPGGSVDRASDEDVAVTRLQAQRCHVPVVTLQAKDISPLQYRKEILYKNGFL
jgi:hypothetical protein